MKVERPDETPLADYGHRVWIVFTPAANGVLPTAPSVIHDLPYGTFVGTSLPIDAGWEKIVLALEKERRVKLKVDLNAMTGGEDILASRAYWVNPTFEDGCVLSIGSYERRFDTQNVIEIYSDDGSGNDPSVPKFIGVQVPSADQAFDVESGEIECEFVDIVSWILRNTLPGDVSAWALENAGSDADGPYATCRNAVWSSGGRTYTHTHGDHPQAFLGLPVDKHREYTFFPLAFVYESIVEVMTLIAVAVLRKNANIVHQELGSETPLEHWELFAPDFLPDYAYNSTAPIPSSAWSVLGKVALHHEPDVLVHGLFYVGENAGRDTLGGWPNLFEFLKDTTTGGAAKMTVRLDNVSADNAPDIWIAFGPVKAPLGSALPLAPTDFDSKPKVTTGRNRITSVSVTVPAGGQNDQPAFEVGRTSDGEKDGTFAMPRCFHTLPILWPDGERNYDVPSDALHCDVITRSINCLTLWFKTTAGGLLSSAEYVRIHQHVRTTDGVATYESSGDAYTFPAPDPIDQYDSNSAEGDTDFGSPLRQAYLRIQRQGGMPVLCANILLDVFGSSMITDYEGEVAIVKVAIEELGNRVAAAGFPDGSAFVGGATYLGSLPGEPLVASGTFDVLTGEVKIRLEGL